MRLFTTFLLSFFIITVLFLEKVGYSDKIPQPIATITKTSPKVNKKNSLTNHRKRADKDYIQQIADSLMKVARLLKIDPYLLLAVAYHESQLNPYAIHLSSPIPIGYFLRRLGVRYNWYRSRYRYHYTAFPFSREKAVKILKFTLKRKYINYDVGLMQINRQNLKYLGISPEEMFNIDENILVGAFILKVCLLKNRKSLHRALECYHRGNFSRRITSYSRRIVWLYRRMKQES